MDGISRKQEYARRLMALRSERSSWDEQWREIDEVIAPGKARFYATDRNNGQKWKQSAIINNRPQLASRVTSSGMMAGGTSPARPWFGLTTPDPDLAEFSSVRRWLNVVEERIRQTLLKSNFYNAIHQFYSCLADFGTAVVHLDEDLETRIRCYVFPIGQFCLANGPRQNVDTVYRELSMTVRQVVRKFTLAKVSQRVRNLYDRGQYEEWIDVTHVLMPNENRRPVLGAAGKRFLSCWFESKSAADTFLHEGGYDEFPAIAARWDVAGEDVYGVGPGKVALGDARALQVLERKKGQIVAKIVDPPMRGPTSLMNGKASLVPGDITYVDALAAGQTFAPAMEIPPAAVQIVEGSIREHEERIKEAYYADVWLSMQQADRGEMTAREVAERHEEKMLQLGPVVERLQNEAYDPIIERTFFVLLRNGEIPRPPAELQGVQLRVEYTSIMAQALKLVGATGIERFAGFAGNLAAASQSPQVLDKVNFDKVIDEYGIALGIKPDLIRSDEEVDAIRAQRAQAQAAAQQAQIAQQAAASAKTLSETNMDGDSALTRMVGGVAGAAARA